MPAPEFTKRLDEPSLIEPVTFEPKMTDAARAHIDNALCACRKRHGEFDQNYGAFSVAQLLQKRRDAEARATQRLGREVAPDVPAHRLGQSSALSARLASMRESLATLYDIRFVRLTLRSATGDQGRTT